VYWFPEDPATPLHFRRISSLPRSRTGFKTADPVLSLGCGRLSGCLNIAVHLTRASELFCHTVSIWIKMQSIPLVCYLCPLCASFELEIMIDAQHSSKALALYQKLHRWMVLT
jgi:hypothetical protein